MKLPAEKASPTLQKKPQNQKGSILKNTLARTSVVWLYALLVWLGAQAMTAVNSFKVHHFASQSPWNKETISLLQGNTIVFEQ